VYRTLSHCSKLPNLFRFLFAWFILSDGFSTIASTAILFAQTDLGVPKNYLIIAAMVVPLSALLGNYFWLWVQKKLDWTSRAMIILISGLYCVLPIYGLLGFIMNIGLRHSWEVWPIAIYNGFLLGAIQSFCRVMFASLLPPGRETEFFALYEITDKGSAWIGPLVIGIIADHTHNKRYAFWFLLGMLFIPILVLLTTDIVEGKKDAALFLEKQQEIRMMNLKKKMPKKSDESQR